ncbi:MAG TPA: hypothetical protein VEG29_06515 [Candidatus Binatia bacterium]|nr:hypothetical protein [Candidatus Binatia bacterium]
MATTVRVPGLLPSTSALKFANSWPHQPDLRFKLGSQFEISVGDAANGLCGGMAFVTADHHNAGAPIWTDSEPPAEGSDHFKALVRRQLDSFDFGLLPARFYLMQAFRNDAPDSWSSTLHIDGRAARTARDEWPTVQARLDAGQLVNLGLVRTTTADPRRLTSNHQVLAYGYSIDDAGAIAIAIYDPNHAADDSIEIRLTLDPTGDLASLSQSTGEPLFAFFVAPYRPKPPTA